MTPDAGNLFGNHPAREDGDGRVPASPEPADAPEMQECWRCGKLVREDLSACNYCRARLRPDRMPSYRRSPATSPASANSREIKALIWFYAAFLVTSIIFAAIQHAEFHGKQWAERPRVDLERELLDRMIAMEVVDTILVVVAVCAMSPKRSARQTGKTRLTTWAVAGPLLGVIFGLNCLYFMLVQRFVGEGPLTEAIQVGLHTHYWLVLAAVCVQPGIVEELFFRYLALGQLRRVMGMHGAVWVSGAMFGLAHLYNPIGMPYLVVMGACMGYVRVASGGLTLPILMHGVHNFLVLMSEAPG